MTYDIIKIPSPNCSDREGNAVKALVIHCIGLDLADVIHGFSYSVDDGGLGVSAHYVVPQITGQEFCDAFGLATPLQFPDQIPVIQFVDEDHNAWHAGQSWWGNLNTLPGCENTLNPCSIGIEFHSPGYDDKTIPHTFAAYTPDQIRIGALLMQNIIQRHAILPNNVAAHSDIAPLRMDGSCKTDPGPLFPWKDLYDRHGIGFWPDFDLSVSDDQLKERLLDLGYTTNNEYALNAFKMRFCEL